MKLTIGIVVALALVAAGFLFMYSGTLFEVSKPRVGGPTGTNLYANGTYGISFPYPAAYLISEGERGTPQRPHYALTLVHEDNVSLPIGGEGPTAITIDIYPNSQGKTLEGWITTNSESNFGLGPRTYTKTTIGDEPALSYRWSGLYEGETTALLHDGSVILVSVTYLAPEDAIVGDYRALIQGLTLSK